MATITLIEAYENCANRSQIMRNPTIADLTQAAIDLGFRRGRFYRYDPDARIVTYKSGYRYLYFRTTWESQ